MSETTQTEVPEEERNKRLDQFIAKARPEHSRVRWQELIKNGDLLLNGKTTKINAKTRVGDIVSWIIPAPVAVDPQPEDIPLDIIFEDASIIVINKPAGLVVHPAPGHANGTLVNALLHHCTDLQGIGGELRPGIVHRLDKDTSGAIIVAKSENAMNQLMHQFKARKTTKEYIAIVKGLPYPTKGTIQTNIARSDSDRKKMAAYTYEGSKGKHAITHYRTEAVHGDYARVRCHIETGRTHQIRVHLAHIGHPILGDSSYGKAPRVINGTPVLRQMLHAAHLEITHPTNGEPMVFEAPLHDDMKALLKQLKLDQ